MRNRFGRTPLDRSPLEGKYIIPFRDAIRSEATRDPYERRLLSFLNDYEMDVDTFVRRAKKNPRWAQDLIIKDLRVMKERMEKNEIASGTVGNMKKPIKLLLEMNDISGINWKKISKVMPRVRSFALDRAPRIDELRRLVSVGDLRFQSIILVMVSSGIRVGAWDSLNWGDVSPITIDGKLTAAKLIVYRSDPEQYLAFMSPEAYEKISEYMDLRAQHGETVSHDSFLLRDRWEPNQNGSPPGNIMEPERLTGTGVRRLWERLLWRYGIRTEPKRRHEFTLHSLRKYFKTRAEQVMKPINVEVLMGHSTGISDSYYRPTENLLLEDYVNAIPLLTLSETDEVRRVAHHSQVETNEMLKGFEARLSRIQVLESQIQGLRTSLGVDQPSQDQLRSENTEPSSHHSPKKVVDPKEVEQMISDGWDPVMNLPNGKVVMRMLKASPN